MKKIINGMVLVLLLAGLCFAGDPIGYIKGGRIIETDDGVMDQIQEVLDEGSRFTVVLTVDTTDMHFTNNTQVADSSKLLTATGGALVIQEVIVQTINPWTNSTKFEFSTNNVSGDTGVNDEVIEEAAAGFAAAIQWNATTDATLSQLPFVLESGKSLYLHGDDGIPWDTNGAVIVIVGYRTEGATPTPGW